MAILQMKKLKCAVVRSEKEAFLKDLTKLGCVQIDETEAEEYNLLHEKSDLIDLRTKHARMLSAISILNAAVPEKSKLLCQKPELEKDEFLDENGISEAVSHAEEILSADERIKAVRTEESKIRADMESFIPWKALDIPLDLTGTKTTDITFGTVPARVGIRGLENAAALVTDEAELFVVNEDKSLQYVILISYREVTGDVLEAIRGCGFNALSFQGIKQNALTAIKEAEKKLSDLAAEKSEKEEFIKKSCVYRDMIKLGADKLSARIEIASAEEKLICSDKVDFFAGWIPEEKVSLLDDLIAGYDAAYETETPSEEEYPSVPVSLKNNKLTNSLNMVTNMYSLPQYGSVDPNPWMAPFFILFYGLMMADMGYGLIMIAAGIVALRKMKPRGNSLAFCQLLLYSGIATFICGALTGGFFSDVLYQLVHLFNPESTWGGLPYLFSPVNDSEMVLYGSLVLGVIHLNVGMICSFIQKVKHRNIAGAIWEEGTLWFLLISGILTFFGIGNINGIPVLLIAAILLLLFGAGREAKGFKKVTAAFGCIYNTATGWFGDILSYSRIMALMLAGGVVGQVFNTVAVMPMQSSGVNIITIIAFVVIFLLGHAMNFGLNLLGCYVHDLRLQCLEYFGKFYTDGGKAFTPLDIKGKFINPKNN